VLPQADRVISQSSADAGAAPASNIPALAAMITAKPPIAQLILNNMNFILHDRLW